MTDPHEFDWDDPLARRMLTVDCPVCGAGIGQLKDCAEIAALIPDELISSTGVELIKERQLRPLRWLKKYQYQDRVPQIVERAITIGNGRLTGDITRQALNEWKLEYLGPMRPLRPAHPPTARRLAPSANTTAKTYGTQRITT